MNAMNYGLRVPTREEVTKTFGSAKRALEVTGGDIPALLYLIHNPAMIPTNADPKEYDDGMASTLRAWCCDERDELIRKAWNEQTNKRRSVAEVMRVTGHGFELCARVLDAAELRK